MNIEPNDIPVLQNAPENLRRLAAQRRLYSRAKLGMTALMVASVLTPVVLAALSVWRPELRAWVAVYGIVITMLDLALLDDMIRNTQRCAAAIQEDFDCAVLHLEHNPLAHTSDGDAEQVASSAEAFRQSDTAFSTLRDWYAPAVGDLPLPLARLLCQRTNLRWDKRLRRNYARGLLALVIVLGVVTVALGLCAEYTVETLVVRVLAPVLPLAVWGIREYKRQSAAAESANRLKQHVESLWERALNGTMDDIEAARASRALQDAIFERRCNSPMVFDWVYRCFKRSYEHETQLGAEEMIRQAKTRFGLA